MTSFDELWKGASGFRKVSPRLRTMLEDAWTHLSSGDVRESKRSLEALLTFLAGEGRTDANCTVTDYFFSAAERQQPSIWQHLPPALQEVLGSIGGCLHDTIHAPEIAENFESTPELLLERLRGVPDSDKE